tara:strand:- start:728 stop:1039 length:312 start_codon:yes stop_codon:yes gene_type:complete
MEYGSLPELITGFTALILAFGGGIRWMISWSDKKLAAVQAQLELQYTSRFAMLEERVNNQEREIQQNREDLARYLRHVGKLEGLLTANGIEPPAMEVGHYATR